MPCYNEEFSVRDVVTELADKLKAMGQPFELIAVNDGSTDGTKRILEESKIPDRIINHRSNRGYGASIKAGIRAASHEWVLIMDSDGQHPPENVPLLTEHCGECDMVVGARKHQSSHHWRMPGKYLLRKLCEFLVGRRIPDVNSCFRLLRKSEALKYTHLCSDQFSFSTSITLAFMSDRLPVCFVPIDIRPRKGGNSLVNVGTGLSTFMLILRIIGTFSPLKIFMPPTILTFVVGFSYMTWGLITEFHAGSMAVILVIVSAILFCFGLIADQLALLRREISRREAGQ